MQANPLVSICVPLYNGSKFIKAAIDSCINQSYTNVEIIVVDDGSTDDSIRMMEDMAMNYPQIKFFSNKANLGLVKNWEKCIELASGDWIKFLFQDDYMYPDCVEKMMKAAIKYNAQFVLCAREFIFDESALEETRLFLGDLLVKPEHIFRNKEYYTPDESIGIVKSFLFDNVLGEPICTLFHKELFSAVGGFDKSLRQLVDYEFNLKIILNYPFAFIPEKLIEFRVHSESESGKNTTNKTKEDQFKPTLIQSIQGDQLKLIEIYRTNKLFEPLKKYWGEDRLDIYEQFIYLHACRRKGAERIDDILKETKENSPHLRELKYGWLKYKFMKMKYKRLVKPFLNEGKPDYEMVKKNKGRRN